MKGEKKKAHFFLIFFCSIYAFQSIFVLTKIISMFEFDQYLGFLAFLTILTIGFWLMIFLLTFVVPYWLFGNIKELLKEKRDKKRAAREA
jgi:hypothetical protein